MTLRDLEAGDLFDVLHVLYEEDITPLWEQHIDVKDRVREAIYPLLYNRPYKFATTKARKSGGVAANGGGIEGPGADWAQPEDFGGTRETKPYIPPSSEADLMRVLEAPMGG